MVKYQLISYIILLNKLCETDKRVVLEFMYMVLTLCVGGLLL